MTGGICWSRFTQRRHSPGDWLCISLYFATGYGPRPLQGLTAFLVTSIAGASPKALQFISTLLVLAAALSLRSWLKSIMSIFPRYRNVVGDFAVIFWLAMPWMLGETAWPTQIHNVGVKLIFTELARLLLVRERLTAGLAALVTLGIVASSLFYEAFYFAIVPVVVFYSIVGRGPAKTRRDGRAGRYLRSGASHSHSVQSLLRLPWRWSHE